MFTNPSVITQVDQFPIRTQEPVHSGKVRSVYWLTPDDSQRLQEEQSYLLAKGTRLGVMIISDRISAFECNWKAEGDLAGIPGKGAALNSIAAHWFHRLEEANIGAHHIVAIPHPLVWIVQRAEPILVESITRHYLTGSLWRAYQKGERSFGGMVLPEGCQMHQQLKDWLFTPTTKGILTGIPGIPEQEDSPVTYQQVATHFRDFRFDSEADLNVMKELVLRGSHLIAEELSNMGQIFVDTKFELGYGTDASGQRQMMFIDEVGTPDSSRFWSSDAFQEGCIVEYCKEYFRQHLLDTLDRDILLDANRMTERKAMAERTVLPQHVFLEVGQRYQQMAESITGQPLPISEHPQEEIMDVLASYKLLR